MSWVQILPPPLPYILIEVYKKIGRIAQLGEHLPYKQGVIGSSPIVPTNETIKNLYWIINNYKLNCGPVAQVVRAHA